MSSHAPPDYACPFCALVRGEDLPTAHYENLYVLPERLGSPLLAATQRVASALKAA